MGGTQGGTEGGCCRNAQIILKNKL
jgi:hypothetical protein